MKLFASLLASVLMIAVAAPSSPAAFVVLPPGSTVALSPGQTSSDIPNVSLLAQDTYNLTSPTTGTKATVVEDVFLNKDTGTLLFAYQETNTGANALTSLSMTNFSNINTSVDFLTDSGPAGSGFTAGGVAPNLASRNATTGSLISFTYNGGLAAGQTGDILLIQTNVTAYDQAGALISSATVSGNGSASFNGVFEPSGAVPEPSSMVLIGIAGAIVGVGSYARRRKA